jgi:glyoxylase-like metal-dependent hydrolase (beta-lactamase superfamily II)
MPDVGTARCDFPGGDANALYQSIHRLLSLPAETTLYMCHDYPKNGRPVRLSCTISEQRAKNIHVADGITQAEFVAARSARDKTLEVPALLLPSVQININAGTLPHPESNGISYLKIPLNAL